jgi:thioredoxin-related protein
MIMRTVLAILLALVSGFLPIQKATAGETATVKWLTIEEAEKLNAKNPRKILIDVYTDWCGWCKVMDANTFPVEDIAAYINAYFYPVKLNAEGKNPITFGGRTYTTNPQLGRTHELAATLLSGRMSYPTIAYMDETLQMITIVPGYQTPENLRPILVFISQNHYKDKTWEAFLQEWPKIAQDMQNQ